MITHKILIAKGFRWLGSLMGVSFLALAACAQMVQPAASAQPAKAYVGNFKDNTVSVIDTDAGKVVATVPVAAGPHGMALTPDNKLLLVTVYGENRLAVIDTATQAVVATIAVPNPHTVAISPD